MTQCEEPFEVSGTGPTKEDANDKAYQNAKSFCERTLPECPKAKEVGPGEYEYDPNIGYTYTTRYKCTIEP